MQGQLSVLFSNSVCISPYKRKQLPRQSLGVEHMPLHLRPLQAGKVRAQVSVSGEVGSEADL